LKIQGDTPETGVQPFKAHRHFCRVCYRKAKRTTWTMNTTGKVIWIVIWLNFTPRNLRVLPHTARSYVLTDRARLAAAVWWSPDTICSTFANLSQQMERTEKKNSVGFNIHDSQKNLFLQLDGPPPHLFQRITFILQASFRHFL